MAVPETPRLGYRSPQIFLSSLSTRQQMLFSRNFNGFFSKPPLQPSSLCLPFASSQLWLSQYFTEMRRALNQESRGQITGPPAPNSPDKWLDFSKPRIFPLSKEYDDTCPICLKVLWGYSAYKVAYRKRYRNGDNGLQKCVFFWSFIARSRN